ncbi:MAG: DinB family protein [candidate division NC10 bacterium]|nr:DinB family protein [candidate division NC10 bacterium]MBI2115893.1 DinB family protein [candidate division NC10 bacterium]MBI2455359.1 DinB family protein [candidate division NC10 bacterium]MBI2564016.1 DinB family protein [candidate division NC10 bacterium]MBI3085847.1 DinB family protein [candidate division NC10 bacterium]
MPDDKALRAAVLTLLRGGSAHISFEKAVANLPEDLRGKKPRRAPYTPWQQLEHMRIAQWDILEYIRSPQHISPAFPEGYWPGKAAPPARNAWAKSVRAFQADRQALLDLATDPSTDLLVRIPHVPDGPTILHELLLVADHNAYHLGQLIVLRRLLGAWRD